MISIHFYFIEFPVRKRSCAEPVGVFQTVLILLARSSLSAISFVRVTGKESAPHCSSIEFQRKLAFGGILA